MDRMLWMMALTAIGVLIGLGCGWLVWGQHLRREKPRPDGYVPPQQAYESWTGRRWPL